MKKLFLTSIFIILCMCNSDVLISQVVINEYSAANQSQYFDNYGKTEDWIELYNTSSSPASIGGLYLSDDSLAVSRAMWQIPAGTTIGGNQRLCIWASGRNVVVGTNYHTNFKLTQTKSGSEYLTLSNAAGTILDMVQVKKTKLGQSRGRASDGNPTWGIFLDPTYNSPNGGNFYSKFADKPSFDLDAGFYSSATTVTITNDESSNSTIHYTIDGREPTVASPTYTTPITIASTSVLKAVCISQNSTILPSFLEYKTYFINNKHELPVMSIAGNEVEVLANGDNTLKPPGSVEYFIEQVRVAKSYGEYNSHGQDSWANSHRSLDFVARDEMGYSRKLDYKIFANTPRSDFQRLIIRAAGDDNYPADFYPSNTGSAHLRDAYFQNLCKDGGLGLDVRRGSKCVVYLNGKYWGLYDLREKPDDSDYTEYYYNQDKYNIEYMLTWGSTWSQYGDNTLANWADLRNYVLTNDMNVASNFDYVDSQLDYKSLIDYVISHSLSVSKDWLNYNTGVWRGLNPDGGHKKWGYILWDNDAAFGFYINYTGIPDETAQARVCNVDNLTAPDVDIEGHIAILNKLRTNPTVNQYYIARYADLMNTTFSCETMLHKLDSTKNLIDSEMHLQAERWGGTYEGWQTNYNELRSFIEQRCGTNSQNGMNDCYNLTGPYDVTFTANPTTNTALQINSIEKNILPWTASYYGGMDILLDANTTVPGCNFSNWNTTGGTLNLVSTTKPNSVRISGASEVQANFNCAASINEKNTKNTIAVFPTLTQGDIHAQLELSTATTLDIEIISPVGTLIKSVASSQKLPAGKHQIDMDITNLEIAAGTYFVRIITDKNTATIHKIIYAK